MKTLTELYKETLASDELKKEYFAAANDKNVTEFLRAHGCDADEKELDEFFKSPAALPLGEIADDELDAVAGGACHKGGRKVVSPFNNCDHWLCENCHIDMDKNLSYAGACPKCKLPALCSFCVHCYYEGGLMTCHYSDNR